MALTVSVPAPVLIEQIEAEIAALRLVSAPEEFPPDPASVATANHRFLAAIKAGTAMGRHLLASAGLHTPLYDVDVFDSLLDAGFVSEADAQELKWMVCVRVLLVNEHLRMEDRRVLRTLRDHLDQLDRFRTSASALLAEQA